jgi:hypothetical protein
MKPRWIASLVAGAVVTIASITALTGHVPAAAGPVGGIDPADFTSPVANPYFPLMPGTVLHYRGSEDGEHFRERVAVMSSTKTILGVETTVLLDVLRRADGSLAEKTHDWYADDNHGNVWYFGEQTATYDRHGHVQSREGSWQAGVDGATPGTVMPSPPTVTDAYRQEFRKGEAEDQAWIVQRGKTVKVPAGTYRHVVKTLEWSRLEPGVVSVKVYAPDVGIVAERDLSGGSETFRLTSVTRPG